jgi:hypothetical protein
VPILRPHAPRARDDDAPPPEAGDDAPLTHSHHPKVLAAMLLVLGAYIRFMNLVVQRYRRKQLHVVLDNSSSHSTPQVKAWLEALLRNPRQAVAQRHRLLLQDRSAGAPPCLHARVEPEPHAFRLDKARRRHHQVTPPNAEALLDDGALGRQFSAFAA